MSALRYTPSNMNLQSVVDWEFILHRGPSTRFFIQQCSLPSLDLSTSSVPSPLGRDIPWPGNKIEYHPLSIGFKLAEDWSNYFEIHDWLRALGAPEDTEEYKALKSKQEGFGVFSDITILAKNGKKNVNTELKFLNCFPIHIGSGNDFSTFDDTYSYFNVVATFQYMLFNPVKSNG